MTEHFQFVGKNNRGWLKLKTNDANTKSTNMDVSGFSNSLLHTIQELVEAHLAAITLYLSLSHVVVEEFVSSSVHWRSQHSVSGWDFGPMQVMLFFSSRSVFGIFVLLVERIQALAAGLTFNSKIPWCADESTVDSTTARCPGSVATSALHPRPIVCADTLFAVRQTWLCALFPTVSPLVLLSQRTLFQTFSLCFRCNFANLKCAAMLFLQRRRCSSWQTSGVHTYWWWC